MAFTEDRSVFFQTGDFATAATYDGATEVNGILDEEYTDVSLGGQVGVGSTRPVFLYNADDITTPTVGVNLVVGAVTYKVRDVEINRDVGKLVLEAT